MPTPKPILERIKDAFGVHFKPAIPEEIERLRQHNVSGNSLQYFANYNFLMEKDCFRFWDAANVLEMMETLHPNADVWRQGFAAFASDLEGRVYCFDQNSLDERGNARIVRLQYGFNPDVTIEEISRVAEPIAKDVEEFLLMYAENRIPGWNDDVPAEPPPLPNPALTALMQPDEILARIVGPGPIPRDQITEKFWDYVKKHKLHEEGQMEIDTDDNLKALSGGKSAISIFEATLYLIKHSKKYVAEGGLEQG